MSWDPGDEEERVPASFDPFAEQEGWPPSPPDGEDDVWAEGTAFDPERGEDDDADDQVIPPSAPLAQPGAFNLPYPKSREQEERESRHARRWPYADAPPWDPDPTRAEREGRHHTANWPLPQPRPIQEPEP